jgi:hypothetical protein
VNLFRFIPGYETHVYNDNKEPLLFLFLALLITFALTRLYTRLARARGWGSGSAGGVHVHHVVIGVILMGIAGLLAFTQFSYSEIVYSVSAILFGVGFALMLDEFAMIFHLRDVYWAEEGRTSIDALLMGTAAAGMILVMASPFTHEGQAKPDSNVAADIVVDGHEFRVHIWITLLVGLFFAAILLLKKKPFLAIIGFAVLPVGIAAALRLAKPGSPWSRWFYTPRTESHRSAERRARKLDQSLYRFTEGRSGRFERWFSDFIGGAPSPMPDGGDTLEPDETPGPQNGVQPSSHSEASGDSEPERRSTIEEV